MNPPVAFPKLSPKKLAGKHNVLFVNSFAPDEPLEEIVQVAESFTDIYFYITGDLSKAPRKIVGDAPKNVFFTDFVSYEEYIRLMTSVDGVLCFTTRDHTLLSGGEEALFMGKPLLTFDFSFLRSFFNLGTVFVNTNTDAIRKGVIDLIQNRKQLSNEMTELRKIKLKTWKKDLANLNKIVMDE
jgi:glycosyltransferase involved in cell wall biosynthesis